MKKLLFILLLACFPLISFANTNCYNISEQELNYTNPNHECFTSCSLEDIKDRVPGCFSKGLKAPDQSMVNEQINESDLRTQIFKIIDYALTFLGLLLVIAIVYAGVLLVSSMGEDETEKAKNILKYSAIGVVLIFLSYPIANVILDIAGIDGRGRTPGGGDSEYTTGEEDNTSTTVPSSVDSDLKKIADMIGKLSPETIALLQKISQNPLQNLQISQILQELLKDPLFSDLALKLSNQDQAIKDALAPLLKGNISPELKTLLENLIKSNNISDSYKNLSPADKELLKKALQEVYGGDFTESLLKALQNPNEIHLYGDIAESYKNLSLEQQKALEEKILAMYPDALAKAFIQFLKTGKLIDAETEKAIRDALRSQNYPSEYIDALLKKLNEGKNLSGKEMEQVTNSLKYGYLLEQLETELSLTYKAMPKTSENVLAYNEVLTLLTEAKKNPSNERGIVLLQNTVRDFLALIAKTPKVQAKITASPARGPAPLMVTFDGSESIDPNHITLPHNNFSWSFTDHQGTEQQIGKGPLTEYTFTEPGMYIVLLQVATSKEENGYKTAMDGIAKVQIRVEAPVSNIITRIQGETVSTSKRVHISDAQKGISFDASLSTPQLGRSFTQFLWKFGNGNSEQNNTGASVMTKYESVGTYLVSLEITDNTGEVFKHNIQLIIEHLTANIEVSPPTGNINTRFEISGSKSKTADNKNPKYSWEVISEEGRIIMESENASFEFLPLFPGEHTIKLLISDSENKTSIATHSFFVSSLAPNANFVLRNKSPSTPSLFLFDGGASNDPNNDPLTYSWDFENNGVFDIIDSSSPLAEYSYSTTGIKKPRLVVKDPYGETSTVTKTLMVESLLDIDFEVSSYALRIGEEVTFTPLSDRGKNFYWSLGDGTNQATDKEPLTYSYQSSGSVIVRLTAFDENNNENTASKRIFIGDIDTPFAAFKVEVDGFSRFPQEGICSEGPGIVLHRRNSVKFLGNLSQNINGTSNMLDFTWDFGDGTYSSNAIAAQRYSETNTKDSCYSVTLQVKDRVTGTLSQKESVFILVENLPPELSGILLTQTNTSQAKITPYPVSLRVENAYDPDGKIESYRWWYRKKGEDISVQKGIIQTQQPFAVLMITQDGLPGLDNEYVFSAELTDNDGETTLSDNILGESQSIVIRNGNISAPEVDFQMDNNRVFSGDTVSFFAYTSLPSPTTLQYEWDFNGDGIFDETSSSPQINKLFEAPGEYTVHLRVRHQGLVASKRKTLTVERITRFPLSAFTYQVNGFTVYTNAATSRYDPALKDTTLSFEWDFDTFTDATGDGNPANDIQSRDLEPSFTYKKPGLYSVKLTVIDSLGIRDSVIRQVHITGDDSFQEQEILSGKRGIRITSPSTPLTTLDLSLEKSRLSVNETMIIGATIKNADLSLYSGEVDFTLIIEDSEGSVSFSADRVRAINGQALTNIVGISQGRIVIQAFARNTFHGNIEEKIEFSVISAENSGKPDLDPQTKTLYDIK
jgi:PKD repeat protein